PTSPGRYSVYLYLTDTYLLFTNTASTDIFTLSLHDALPIYFSRFHSHHQRQRPCSHVIRFKDSAVGRRPHFRVALHAQHLIHKSDRKSTRLNSSHRTISYAVFCLTKKTREFSMINIS